MLNLDKMKAIFGDTTEKMLLEHICAMVKCKWEHNFSKMVSECLPEDKMVQLELYLKFILLKFYCTL